MGRSLGEFQLVHSGIPATVGGMNVMSERSGALRGDAGKIQETAAQLLADKNMEALIWSGM